MPVYKLVWRLGWTSFGGNSESFIDNWNSLLWSNFPCSTANKANMKTNKSLIVIQIEFEAWNNTTFWTNLCTTSSSSSSSSLAMLTLPVWVLRLLSVAKPFPQMLQWNGRFFNLSIWDSWFRRCCCRLDSWMKARPHSGMWHLYGRSPTKWKLQQSN